MKEIINTGLSTNVPLSHAVKAGDFIFVSGQVPMDPDTNKVVSGGVQEQTRMVFKRISRILEAAGASLQDVVKVTVLMTDISKFEAMNQAYKEFFPLNPPARSCFEIKLAIDVALEVEVIAYQPGNKQ